MAELTQQLALAAALGLLGFIEPCSLGAHLLFLQRIAGDPTAARLRQLAIFALTRSLFIGGLGALAALIGREFLILQRGGWLFLGALYGAVGMLYVTGRAGLLMHRLGPSLAQLPPGGASVALGLLFGLNIPACAAPLLLVILGRVALGDGALGAGPMFGFVVLGTFGLALSAPLGVLASWPWLAEHLDRLFVIARRLPRLIGLVLLGLSLWTLYLGIVTASPV